MSREEIVRVVCRALAVIEIIATVTEASYLPARFVSLAVEVRRAGDFIPYERINLAFLFFRIAFLVFTAAVLWNCGPWIQRVMGIVGKPSAQGQLS